eukprot:288848-Prymnesium_polylepis.1
MSLDGQSDGRSPRKGRLQHQLTTATPLTFRSGRHPASAIANRGIRPSNAGSCKRHRSPRIPCPAGYQCAAQHMIEENARVVGVHPGAEELAVALWIVCAQRELLVARTQHRLHARRDTQTRVDRLELVGELRLDVGRSEMDLSESGGLHPPSG